MNYVVVIFHEDEPQVHGPFEDADTAAEYVEKLEKTHEWANRGVSVDWFPVEPPITDEDLAEALEEIEEERRKNQ